MEQIIRNRIYHVPGTFWFSLALMVVLAVIFGAIAVAEKGPILGTVGIMVAIFLPIIFMTRIKALYTKEALIKFDKDTLTISAFHTGKEEQMEIHFLQMERPEIV